MNPQQQTNFGQKAQDTTSQLADQAREKTSEIAQQAQDTAKTTIHEQKGRAAETVSTLAGALRQTGQHLDEQDQGNFGQFAHQAADRLEQFSNDLQNKSVDEIFDDVQNFARRDPQLFLGGALVLGLFAARFLKSSSQRQQQRQMQTGYGQYGQYRGQYRGYQSQPNRGYYNRQDLDDYRRDVLDDEYTGTYNRGSYGYTPGERATGASSGGLSNSDAGFPAGEDFSGSETDRGFSTGTTGTTGATGTTGSDPFTGWAGKEPHIPPYPGSGPRTDE